jgi:GDP-4-dehydro-6-deoxy-D-mannose reductase
MKTVLVTGATGALGQAVIARLCGHGHYRVFATSRRPSAVTDFQLDVRDRNGLASAINSAAPDLVLHLAATFSNDFDEAYSVNVAATRHLLGAVEQSGRRTRVLLVGSAAEYGVVRPDENPIWEDRVLVPVSIYGLTKAWQTQLAGFYAHRGVDVVVARIFNLDGPGLSERLFIGRLQRQIEEVMAGRKSAIEVGPLTAIRDYVCTNEAADQILAIATCADAGSVYHVASGIPVRMRDILARYLNINKLDVSIVQEADQLSNRIGYDVPVIYANITKTSRLMRDWEQGGEA